MTVAAEACRIALDAVRAHKLRSLLTVTGNVVAVTSIIAMVSLIGGLNSAVSDVLISELGADTFIVDRTPIIRSEQDFEKTRHNPSMSRRDVDVLRAAGGSIHAVMVRAEQHAEVRYGDRVMETVRVQGVSREYLGFSTFSTGQGRLMGATEIDSAQPVAVLGADTARRLFGGEPALGKLIRIRNATFEIIGVSEAKGAALAQSQDEFVIIPFERFRRIFGARPPFVAVVQPTAPDRLEEAMSEATAVLRIGRRLRPGAPDNFGLFTADTFLNIYQDATRNLFAVLVGIVSLSLLVGGVVIMNIMLMAVSERTHEIGLRKALGATRRAIVWQFLAEAITLSTIGGLLGTLFGVLLALAISSQTPLPPRIEPWSIAAGIAMSLGVGLFFGIYPAMRAARLSPIEAIRRE